MAERDSSYRPTRLGGFEPTTGPAPVADVPIWVAKLETYHGGRVLRGMEAARAMNYDLNEIVKREAPRPLGPIVSNPPVRPQRRRV